MTARLFLGNFDFEHRLAHPQREPSEKLKRLNAEMASAWLSIANDGDWIWTPSPIDESFFHDLSEIGLPKIKPVVSLVEVPRDTECIPWGWSADVWRLAERFQWKFDAPSLDAVRVANSRATSEELERRWHVGLQGACRIETIDEFRAATRALGGTEPRWVVKAVFGMSARERILGRGSPREPDENWVRRRLTWHRAVFFEPWVDRIDEVGIQIDVPKTGLPTLVGLTPMLVDAQGQYAGSWFQYDPSRFQHDERLWSQAIEVALRAASELQSQGYFGPLGIDAMTYRNAEGRQHVRPLQDLNARWTMGRLSLGWRRLLGPGEEGCWQHGSFELPIESTPVIPNRLVQTSPQSVGNTRCLHQTRVRIQNVR